MAEPKLTSDLVSDIQVEGYIGVDEDAFTDVQILRAADRVLASEVIPLLAQLGVSYYDAVATIPIETNTGIEERALYNIPSDALGSLTSVHFFDGAGQEFALTETTEVAVATPGRFRFSSIDGGALYYYFRGGRIGLLPNPTTGFLRIRYSAKPFPMGLTELDEDIDHRAIVTRAKQGATLERIAVDAAVPSGWSANDTYQVLTANPPHVPVELLSAAAVSAVAGSNIDVLQAVQWPWSSATIRGSEQPGDLVIRNEISSVVQVPHEAYPALVTRTVALLRGARGDSEKMAESLEVYRNQVQLMVTTMGDRNRSQSRNFVNRASNFYLKGGRRRSL